MSDADGAVALARGVNEAKWESSSGQRRAATGVLGDRFCVGGYVRLKILRCPSTVDLVSGSVSSNGSLAVPSRSSTNSARRGGDIVVARQDLRRRGNPRVDRGLTITGVATPAIVQRRNRPPGSRTPTAAAPRLGAGV